MTGRKEDLSANAQDAVLEVVSEELDLGVRRAVTGRVRVSTHTEMTDQIVRQELESLRAEVVRIPIERTLDPGEELPVPRTEGDVTIIPIFEEILVMETRLQLKEEVHVTTHTSVEEFNIPVTLRRQHAVVDQVAENPDSRRTPQNTSKEKP